APNQSSFRTVLDTEQRNATVTVDSRTLGQRSRTGRRQPSSSAVKEDSPPRRAPHESGPKSDAKTAALTLKFPVVSAFPETVGSIMTSFFEVWTPTRHRLSQGRM